MVTKKAWQSLFVNNMFIRPKKEDLENFTPDFTIINAYDVKEKDWKIWGKGKFCCDIKGPGPSKKTPINLNMGIIDILQKYNTSKLLESLFKTKQHLLDRAQSEVSAINSKAYKKRFDEFMDEIIKPKRSKTRRKRNVKKRRKINEGRS